MAYFYNILYNINVYNEVIIVFIYIQFNNNNCASVFHTQYYHGAQFHLKYNHDLHPKMQINCLCTTWRACFLLHIRLGVSETYFISDTSRHGCKMLQFVIMKLCLVPFFFNTFIFAFAILGYSALTYESHALLTCPSVVLTSCSVYGSENYFTTKYSSVVGSSAFVAPYFPLWTREDICSLVPSNTNWCTSSKSSLNIFLLVKWMMF